MGDERWSDIKNVAADALDYHPDERQAFIDHACGDDLSLRAAVESLLQEANHTDGLMAQPLFDLDAAVRQLPNGASWDDARSDAPAAILHPHRDNSRGVFFWLVIVFGTIFLVLLYPSAVWNAARSGNTVGDFGWTAERSGGLWRVSDVNPAGPAATMLRSNDQILAFDGDPRAREVGVAPYRRFVQIGATYTLRISRDFDGEEQYTIRLPSVTRPGTALLAGTYFVLSVCFCVMALVMGLSKPRHPVARLGCLAGCLASLRLLGFGLAPYVGHGAALRMNELAWLCEPWSLALSYHFLYRFSLPTPRERVWSAVNVAIYGVCSVMFMVSFPLRLAVLAGREASILVRYDHPLFVSVRDFVNGSVFAAFFQILVSIGVCAVILRGYHQARDADQRQRIRWVVLGCLCAFVPLVLMRSSELFFQAIGASDIIGSRAWRGLDYVADVCFIAVPVSLAYAVVKHRVLGVSVVMRRSLQSLLARRVLQVFLLLPFVGLFLPVVRNPNRPLLELFPVSALYPNLLLIGALCLSLRYRDQLRSALDRRFFREAYAQEALLRDTLGRLKDVDTVGEVAQLAADTLNSALHPSFICVLTRESSSGPFVISHASGAVSQPVTAVAHASAARVLGLGLKMPFDVVVPPDVPEGPSADALIVPTVNSRGQPVGLIVLGEKKSDEPYGVGDRELLQGIGDQISLVHEKLWLREQVEEEQRMRRNVLGHLSASINLLSECDTCGACFDADVHRCQHDGSELTHLVPVERVIANRYRLDRRLGEGGMGAVYAATDLELRRPVAVKVTLGALFGNRTALRRFQREAQAVARLHHPNIVEVYDFARISNEGAYLVMELVHGSTWRAELKSRGALPLLTIAAWIDQLLDGLEAAHNAGVVHRDLKPENVLIARGAPGAERIKLVDFGLAALDAPGTHTQKLTMSGAVMGTPGYMAPEQMRGETCDERSDLFSVGMMTVEAITGAHPWARRGYDSAALDSFELPLGRSSPEELTLRGVLRTCLAPHASRRFQSVGDMRQLLVSALRAYALLDELHVTPSLGDRRAK